MRSTTKKIILTACRLSFDGKTDEQIGAELGIYKSTIPRFRKSEIWQEFEQELIDAHKQTLLNAEPVLTLDNTG